MDISQQEPSSSTTGEPTENWSRKRIIKNLIVISSSAFLLFFAYDGLALLQSSMNSEKGVGVLSQATIYVAFLISALVLPKYIITKFGSKLSFVVSIFTYIPYLASNFFPHMSLMIPASVLIGVGASVLWGSQCIYLNDIADMYATLSSKKQTDGPNTNPKFDHRKKNGPFSQRDGGNIEDCKSILKGKANPCIYGTLESGVRDSKSVTTGVESVSLEKLSHLSDIVESDNSTNCGRYSKLQSDAYPTQTVTSGLDSTTTLREDSKKENSHNVVEDTNPRYYETLQSDVHVNESVTGHILGGETNPRYYGTLQSDVHANVELNKLSESSDISDSNYLLNRGHHSELRSGVYSTHTTTDGPDCKASPLEKLCQLSTGPLNSNDESIPAGYMTELNSSTTDIDSDRLSDVVRVLPKEVDPFSHTLNEESLRSRNRSVESNVKHANTSSSKDVFSLHEGCQLMIHDDRNSSCFNCKLEPNAQAHNYDGNVAPGSRAMRDGLAPKSSLVDSKFSRTRESVTAVFFGFHGFLFMSCNTWSNLMTYLVLRENRALNASNCSCGAGFSDRSSSCHAEDFATVSNAERTSLTAICVVSAVLSVVVAAVFLDSLEKEEGKSVSFSVHSLLATLKFERRKEALLLMPASIHIGLLQGFYTADFTKSFIACAWGTYHVGLVSTCFGASCCIFSSFSGWLVKGLSRRAVLGAAYAVSLGTEVLLLVWNPAAWRPGVLFAASALWGTSVGLIWAQIRAFYGVLFKEDEEAAFAGFHMWYSLGYVIIFAVNSYLQIAAKLYLLIVFTVLGVAGYLAVEMKRSVTK